jgi:hypothetical protein
MRLAGISQTIMPDAWLNGALWRGCGERAKEFIEDQRL